MSLKCWDWRFHIFFDEELLTEVRNFLNKLLVEEKKYIFGDY